MSGPLRLDDRISVRAPVGTVWEAIRDVGTHARWHPFVTRIGGQHALGAVRQCDVQMGATSGHTTERCTAFEPEATISWLIEQDSTGFSRMVTDWTAGFALQQEAPGEVVVIAHSSFRPRNLLARLALPLMRGKFHRTQQAILSSLKQFVEARPG